MDHINDYLAFISPSVTGSSITIYSKFLRGFAEYCRLRGIREVTTKVVEEWTAEGLKDGGNINCLDQARRCLKRYFKWAVRHGKAKQNPVDCDQLQKLTPVPADRHPFTADDYRRVLEACRTEYRTYWYGAVMVGWNTGLRVSDVASLKWESIDPEKETMKIKIWKLRRMNVQVEIPIEADLYDYLSELKLKPKYPGNPYVFPDMFGYWQHQGPLNRQFGIIVKKAGLKDLTFHSLRHAFITRMVNAGVDSHIVADITGLSIRQIQTYCHISLEAKREAMIKARLRMNAA